MKLEDKLAFYYIGIFLLGFAGFVIGLITGYWWGIIFWVEYLRLWAYPFKEKSTAPRPK